MKRYIQIVLTIAATLLGFVLLWVFRPTLGLLGGSLAISAALRPLVQRLEERGIGRGLAILIWYMVLLVGLVVIGLIFGVGLSDEISVAAERMPEWYATIVTAWQHNPTVQQLIVHGLPNLPTMLQKISDAGGLASAGSVVLGLLSGTVSNLLFLFAALSLAYYWLIEATHFERLWLSLLPVGTRIRAREIWRNVEGAVGAYIRATVAAMVIASILLLAVYTLLGLPFRMLLALLGGVSHIMPRIGPAITLLVAVLVGLTVSPLEGGLVLLGGAAVQILVHEIATRLMKARSVKVNPLLQVLLILALTDVGGFAAVLFAPPLAALIQLLYANILMNGSSAQAEPSAIDLLLGRLTALQTSVEPNNLEFASTLRRSDSLLQNARALLDDQIG